MKQAAKQQDAKDNVPRKTGGGVPAVTDLHCGLRGETRKLKEKLILDLEK